MHQQRFEAIEAWLLGTMPGPERERFEADLAQDPGLRAEVDRQRENMLAVELGDLRSAMRAIAADDAPAQRDARAGRPLLLRYAAAVAVLFTVAVWWAARPTADERLFARHYAADPGLPVPMSVPPAGAGVSGDPLFHDAMVAYKLGDHAEARAKWAALLPAAPTNDTLRYYIASAALAQGRAEEALPLLQAVAADGGSAFSAKARWYLFLVHLRSGDTAAMDTMGLDDDPAYGERVRAIKSGRE